MLPSLLGSTKAGIVSPILSARSAVSARPSSGHKLPTGGLQLLVGQAPGAQPIEFFFQRHSPPSFSARGFGAARIVTQAAPTRPIHNGYGFDTRVWHGRRRSATPSTMRSHSALTQRWLKAGVGEGPPGVVMRMRMDSAQNPSPFPDGD